VKVIFRKFSLIIDVLAAPAEMAVLTNDTTNRTNLADGTLMPPAASKAPACPPLEETVLAPVEQPPCRPPSVSVTMSAEGIGVGADHPVVEFQVL
jgi:hypothetical protein